MQMGKELCLGGKVKDAVGMNVLWKFIFYGEIMRNIINFEIGREERRREWREGEKNWMDDLEEESREGRQRRGKMDGWMDEGEERR